MAEFTLLPDEPEDVVPQTSTAVAVVEAPVEKPKNKGGRPRKHPPKPPRDPNAPKNKGGRPRKNPLPAPVEDEDDDLKSLSKREVATNAEAKAALGEDADRLIQMIEAGDDEGVNDLLLKRMIQSSIKLIGKVEQGVMDTNGRFGVHSFNGLIMSIRELINDMQAMKDRGAIGQVLIEQVIRPAFMDMGMAIMQEFFKAQQEAKGVLREQDFKEIEKIQKGCRDRIGQNLHKSYETMRDGVLNYLQR